MEDLVDLHDRREIDKGGRVLLAVGFEPKIEKVSFRVVSLLWIDFDTLKVAFLEFLK